MGWILGRKRAGKMLLGSLSYSLDLVDQNIEILNQIAANSPKVEAILVAIANSLNEMPDGSSIVGAANQGWQNGDRARSEAQAAAKGLREHVELGLSACPC